MPEDETSTLGGFLSTLAGKKSSADGVRKDADGKVSPTLKPEEVARYEKIFGIMKKVVNPGPEVGGAERTNTEKVASKAAMEKVAGKSGGGDGDGMYGTIAKMGLLAGLIGAALTSMSEELVDKIKGFTKDIVEFADSTGDEFGKLGGLALKIGAKIGLKGLKMIPFLGSFVNFYYAKKHFDNEEYFDGVYELISGVAGFFPGPGTIISMVMDGYKIYAEIEANKREEETGEKPSFSDILGEQAMKLATFIGNAIKDGKVPILSTLFKFGEGIGYFITGDWKEGLESWSHILPSLLGGKESPLYKSVAGGLNTMFALVQENAPAAFETAATMAGDAWGWMTDMFADIGKVFLGFFDGIMGWIKGTIQKGKDFLWDMIPDVLKPGKEERLKEAQEVANAAGRRGAMDDSIKAIIDRDPEAFYAASGAGAEARQAYLKSQGYGATSLNDGMITKNGRVTAFNNQDDILAAKKGGPIDKMLDGNSAVMKSIQSINSQQLNVLIEIRDSLKSGGNLTFSNASLAQEFFE